MLCASASWLPGYHYLCTSGQDLCLHRLEVINEQYYFYFARAYDYTSISIVILISFPAESSESQSNFSWRSYVCTYVCMYIRLKLIIVIIYDSTIKDSFVNLEQNFASVLLNHKLFQQSITINSFRYKSHDFQFSVSIIRVLTVSWLKKYIQYK